MPTLSEHPYISREVGSGTREVIDHYLQKAGLTASDALQIVMEASSLEALKGLVATGLGFAIMSRVTVDKEIRLGELVQIPLNPRFFGDCQSYIRVSGYFQRWWTDFIQFAKQSLAAASAVHSGTAPLTRRVTQKA